MSWEYVKVLYGDNMFWLDIGEVINEWGKVIYIYLIGCVMLMFMIDYWGDFKYDLLWWFWSKID